MLGPMPGLLRVDLHAADRIGGRPAGVVIMAAMAVAGRLAHRALLYQTGVYVGVDIYTPGGYMARMQTETRDACLRRLNRIEGQVRGVSRMVEEDRYCIDILTQIAAARAALKRVEDEVLRDHVGHCVEGAIASGDAGEQRRKIAELMEVFARAAR